MTSEEYSKGDGISLRTAYLWMIVFAVVISLMMIYSTFTAFATFRHLTETTDEYIELEKAAHDLMEASDYLTEMVQRFTVDGNMEYLDGYFTEAFETNRREKAISKMSSDPNEEAALVQLQSAMDGSKELMNLEYYAMKLVISAKGYTGYPDVLKDVLLTAEDEALSPEDKMRLATDKVLSEEYYAQKEAIRRDMTQSVTELERIKRTGEETVYRELRTEMISARVIITIQTLSIFMMIWMTSRLGINPVLKAIEKIKNDSPIPVVGANEFRYLARTYNKMYSVYKRSVEHLNYKASHDELTGVYNRAGYDLLMSSIDMNSTYFLLFDVDDFKLVNDTYGHEMGDKVLKKLGKTLINNFRSDDYVCRIGGDEFVVFMVHSAPRQHKLITNKITQINNDLADTDDGVVGVSISVGIAHGSEFDDTATMFEHADRALYNTKKKGKHGYSFDDLDN